MKKKNGVYAKCPKCGEEFKAEITILGYAEGLRQAVEMVRNICQNNLDANMDYPVMPDIIVDKLEALIKEGR